MYLICPVTLIVLLRFCCLARTHVDYDVKGDVAVVRINEPNSKVCVCCILLAMQSIFLIFARVL